EPATLPTLRWSPRAATATPAAAIAADWRQTGTRHHPWRGRRTVQFDASGKSTDTAGSRESAIQPGDRPCWRQQGWTRSISQYPASPMGHETELALEALHRFGGAEIRTV